jgi:hypothetical protein
MWRRPAAAAIAAAVALLAMTLPVAAIPAPGEATGTIADPVLVGTGDIASCSRSGDSKTAALVEGIAGTVFTAGDNAYESGSPSEFQNCYDPTWGAFVGRTRPSPGNHDYGTAGAAGYFDYFGSNAGPGDDGYYAYDLGSWRIYSLNSNCDRAGVGGCGKGSPQRAWLKADLAANPRTCVLAYWHHPLFSSGEHGNYPKMRPIWRALHAAGADVVISGHDHDYERFARQRPSGVAASNGIREFVVGTGGAERRAFGSIKANSQVRNAGTFGVLKLTLHATAYEWEFVPVAGETFTDSGSTSCSA